MNSDKYFPFVVYSDFHGLQNSFYSNAEEIKEKAKRNKTLFIFQKNIKRRTEKLKEERGMAIVDEFKGIKKEEAENFE